MRKRSGNTIYRTIVGCALVLNSANAFSQEQLIQQPEHKWLRLAEEQYLQQHYRLAIQSANKYLSLSGRHFTAQTSSGIQRAAYFRTLAQLKLDEPAAPDSATAFLAHVSDLAYKQRISFALAQYFFRHEQLSHAIPYYEAANIDNLTNQEIADAKFELAYAYFNSRNFERAEPLFASIKEVPGKYYLAGNYYYGLLAYNNSKYQEALGSFKRIENEPQYKSIVPYYIAEIYYFMGDRKKALDEAIHLTNRKDKLYYDNELHLLAAQVLFEDQRYGDALPYFEHYYEHSEQIRKEELYEMGYSYYRVNEWKNAVEKFKPLSNADDSLGQTAMYLLGDCYLKTNDKKSARNAFSICADMPYNTGQQEASMLLYGKLSYEMGFNGDAIRSFSDLINKFPSSQYSGEAKTFLSDLLIKTNRYAEAYKALKDVKGRDDNYWKVWQKVTYGYGMQRMRNDDIGTAYELLKASLQHPYDNAYQTNALFWLGDIAYRQNRPQEALSYLRSFLEQAPDHRSNELSPQATLANAYLNMGYASMRMGAYADAQNYFAKSRIGAGANTELVVNASVREADAAFMQKNYAEAISLYDKIIAEHISESDYARMQKGILLGLQGKINEKIELLQQVTAKNPPSHYANEARYELAGTLIEDDRYAAAIEQLTLLANNPDARNFATRALMKLGFAYQQAGNTANAIASYTRVVTDYAGSEDRTAALEALRNLYVETNQPEAYATLLKENNLPQMGTEALDSTYYAAAEAQVAAGKWEAAKNTMGAYLQKFPNGIFTTRANYYKAESHYQLREQEAALNAYDKVLALPWNEFSEASARRAADIAFRMGNYEKAAGYYAMLRNAAMNEENLQLAYSGLMRSYFSGEKYEQAAAYADTLLSMPVLTESVMNEVQFFKARALQRAGKADEALAIYQLLENVDNEPVAAEARYRIAEWHFTKNNLKDAEAAAANVIRKNSGNEYWVVKSYLLLSDIMVKQKDYFNAKATLKSVVKNTRNADLKKEAAQKLEAVKKLEQRQTKLKED